MKIIKYSRINDDGRSGILSITSGGSSSNTGSGTVPSRGGSDDYSTSLNRTIWGQDDTGGDIYGDMEIDGDIIIRRNTPEYDPEEPDDDLSPFGGNITMDGKLTAADIETKEIYATQHLYVPDPNTNVKTDIINLLTDYNDRINQNKANIAANKTEITSLKSLVQKNTTDISNL